MMALQSRREFIRGSAGLMLAPWASQLARAQADGRKSTRLILLGTQGGPARRMKGMRKSPAQVILVNDIPYVIDCGYEVAAQLVNAGISLNRLRYIFITHHHSDHNAEYGNLAFVAFASGLRSRVDAYGPPPLAEMTRAFWDANKYDVETRIKDQGASDPRKLLVAHEFTHNGVVLEDENVKVTSTRVHHPPTDACAYRFDAKDRSIVISGDTGYSEPLIELAKGADVLVHEVMYLPIIAKLLAGNPNAPALIERVKAVHTTGEEVGRVAAKAGVKTLVLSHLLNTAPGDGVTDEHWIEGIRDNFKGQIVVGKDLMEI
jgi:ribonuclease BN (tRNA processing enzyme)